MSRLRLTLEYDGTDFVGWQFQTNGRSVQEELEKAIKQILQHDIRIVGGGRTDAGVHARGQVASFEIDREIDTRAFAKSLNGVLPPDIVVREAQIPDENFHARYSAKSRRYKYYILQAPTAIERNYCWQLFQEVDFDSLQQCALAIRGDHDFRSFSKSGSEVQHHRCIVYSAAWMKSEASLIFEIAANRFLYGMVRALVGTMIDVGRKHTTMEEFHAIVEGRDRALAGMSAPAKGLFLEEISY